jgi:thiamine-monophosphate kinase
VRHVRLGPGHEFDRIRGIMERLGPAAGPLGDDCAVIADGSSFLTISSDLSVERVHFRREWLSLEEIGWRAAAAALSDLAAEGASCIGLLASVGVPKATPPDQIEQLMAGIGAAVTEAGGLVLGGDLTAAGEWVVDITVVGRADRPVRRDGAQPGDGLWVTGALGGARAALLSWQLGEEPAPVTRAAFAHPHPRLTSGRALAGAGATAMLDLSDGLAGDAAHLAAASGCSVRIRLEDLPLADGIARAAGRAGVTPEELAGVGGEDYELLAALPPAFDVSASHDITTRTGVPLTRIGEIAEGGGVLLTLRGNPVSLTGFDHF